MKIESNVLSIMREMLAAPEKNWNSHLPFIQLTEEDFEKAQILMQKHINDRNYKRVTLIELEEYREKYKITNVDSRIYPHHREINYQTFISFLKDKITFRKREKTAEIIENEIKKVFNLERFDELDQKLFFPFDSNS